VGQPLTILIAERNRHVRELLRRELVGEGYCVLAAKDGHEAWEFLNTADPPALLVLDLEIPYLEELADRAHFSDQGPSLPTIIYSYATEVAEHLAVSRDAAFLEKSADLDDLKALVAHILGRLAHPARQE
jgi:DNA-binding NtrC family response regulator